MTEKTIILPPSSNGHGHDASYRLTMMTSKRQYLSYLRERWWVVLLFIALATGGMVAFETVRTPRYLSYAQVYVSGNVQLGIGGVFSEEELTYFGTQIELLKSARLQQEAMDAAGIVLPPGTKKNPYKIEVIQPLKTSILQLDATGPDPLLTQRYLQALIDKYLSYKKETRISTSQELLDTLQDNLSKKAGDLQTEQDKLADYQKSNNVAVLDEEGKSAGAYLSELNMELAKSQLELKLLTEGQTNDEAMLPSLNLTNATAAADLAQGTNLVVTSDDDKFNQAREELALLLGDQDRQRNMGVHAFEEEKSRLERLIAIMLDEKRTRLQERITALQAAVPIWEAKMLSINQRLSQGVRLNENVTREQGYYDHLLGTLENVDLSKNVAQEQLSVLQPASPGQLEPRSFPLRVALAFIGGLCFSLGLVFVWYLLDDRFVSVRDIKDQFGENILGLVPKVRIPSSRPKTALLENKDSRHAYVESFRHLRSALLLSSFSEGRPQTLLFTSASPAEGKTTIAVNLARLLARSGLRVVLVDANTHSEGMRQLLGMEDQPGVLDYLRGNADVRAVVHPTEFEGLSVVPRGTHAEHAEGLFLRPHLIDLIRELRQNRDFVILDGAPILASDDAALLVPHADAIVLVTRPFYTQSRMVRRALDMLYQRQAKHISIILNRAQADDLAGHYAEAGFSGKASGVN